MRLSNLALGYYYRGNLVLDRRMIATNYVRLWLWFDLIASLPYELLLDGSDSDAGVISQSTKIIRVLKFVRFFKIIRLVRVFKLKTIFDKFESFLTLSPFVNALLGFLRLACIIAFIAHWIACIFHMIGDLQDSGGTNSWLITQGLDTQDWSTRYLASIYFAVTTMITVGYGDIVPVTNPERIFVIFTMLMTSIVFAYSMNNINALIYNMQARTQEFRYTLTHYLQIILTILN